MRKIHRVSYTEVFSNGFNPERIDQNLNDMEIEEKLFLLDNLIDYLYVNFKTLRSQADQKEADQKRSSSKKKKGAKSISKQ